MSDTQQAAVSPNTATATPEQAVCPQEESWASQILGGKTLSNYVFWGALVLLVGVFLKEYLAPGWVMEWSHPEWGRATVIPAMGIGVGLIAGFLGGMVGAFISLLSVPLYTIWLGLPVKVALGTNSLASAAIGLFAAWVHFSKRTPNLKVAWPMMVTGFLGASMGAYISLGLPPKTLKMYFSILVFYAAAWMLFRAIVPKRTREGKEVATGAGRFIASGEWKGEKYRTNIVWPAMGNLGIAVICGIVGVGGGFLFTPMLHATFGLPMMVAVGTGNFVKVANIGSQFVVRGVADTVIYQLAFFAMAGGYVGAKLGRRLGCVISVKYLRLFFGLMLLMVGLRYVGVSLW